MYVEIEIQRQESGEVKRKDISSKNRNAGSCGKIYSRENQQLRFGQTPDFKWIEF